MRFETDRTPRQQARNPSPEFLEEPVPNARPLDLDARYGTSLLARLLVIAEIRHQQQGAARCHDDAGRSTESRQVPDIGTGRDEQGVQALRFEQRGERRVSLRPSIAT